MHRADDIAYSSLNRLLYLREDSPIQNGLHFSRLHRFPIDFDPNVDHGESPTSPRREARSLRAATFFGWLCALLIARNSGEDRTACVKAREIVT
jgi:hypothetical protein